MLEAALDENPGCSIVVKLHPEVLAGRKRGYLEEASSLRHCTTLRVATNPWALLEAVVRVYTVSSQLGLEALLCGRNVRCFGMPFYAGWGLTSDELQCSRRTGTGATALGIAEASYLEYANYTDPYFGERISACAAARQIVERREQMKRSVNCRTFYGISGWKQDAVARMFDSGRREKKFFRTRRGAIAAARKRGSGLAVWASKIDARLEVACAAATVPIKRIEDGFIRSVGLGADFNTASSMVLDDVGVYYDSRRPSLLENILNEREFSDDEVNNASALIRRIADGDITKYNLDEDLTPVAVQAFRRVIVVPGQVETDAAVRYSGSSLTTIELLQRVRQATANSYIIFKPHPDVTSGLRPGFKDRARALKYADKFDDTHSIVRLIDIADEVHTVSSLTGFEALLRGKSVACYGLPFYAGWGLTHDVVKCARRQRQLTLEQLVAGALLIYPHYVDPKTGLPSPPEVILDRIREERSSPTKAPWPLRVRRMTAKLKRKFVPV
jgi:capsular polysaccharide export protein